MKRNFTNNLPYWAMGLAMGFSPFLGGGEAFAWGGLPTVSATICDTTRSENTLKVLFKGSFLAAKIWG